MLSDERLREILLGADMEGRDASEFALMARELLTRREQQRREDYAARLLISAVASLSWDALSPDQHEELNEIVKRIQDEARRAQDEVVADLWKVAEWAAGHKCKCILSGPYRGAKCPPCLARTLQAKHKEPHV